MTQQTDAAPNRTVSDGLACAFHEDWLGPHPKCAAEVARVCGVPLSEVPADDWSKYAVWTQMNLFVEKKDRRR